MIKLGVNIDHVATLRQARYRGMPDAPNTEPDPVSAALAAERAGAHGITAHLRADRRHIQDEDIHNLRKKIGTKLNLEMGNSPEIVEFALGVSPHDVCLVPENREEITTEGGLDCAGQKPSLRPTISCLKERGVVVSLFIDPEESQVIAAADLGAQFVELHTGAFANSLGRGPGDRARAAHKGRGIGPRLGIERQCRSRDQLPEYPSYPPDSPSCGTQHRAFHRFPSNIFRNGDGGQTDAAFNERMNFEQFLTSSLEGIQKAGLRRTLRVLQSPQGPEVCSEGRSLANFSSNDYLGLAAHPTLRAAACQALAEAGFGSGASRLICGTHSYHQRLEESLARFKRAEAVLTFSSGYAAAFGTIPAIVGKGDIVILDKLCHACLVDGARLSGALLRVFPHNRLERLESHLEWAAKTHPTARVLVVVESVYSMDGDCAPLVEIVELKDRFGAWLLVDEAHGIGVLGKTGRGASEDTRIAGRIELQMGTLGKALGTSGAYVCGAASLRDFLVNRARSFIFSTRPAATLRRGLLRGGGHPRFG